MTFKYQALNLCIKRTFYVSKTWSNAYGQELRAGREAMEIITALLLRRNSNKNQKSLTYRNINYPDAGEYQQGESKEKDSRKAKETTLNSLAFIVLTSVQVQGQGKVQLQRQHMVQLHNIMEIIEIMGQGGKIIHRNTCGKCTIFQKKEQNKKQHQ